MHRIPVPVVAAWVLGLLVAGCVEPDGSVTALDARPEAETAALLWDHRAVLVGVFALATLDLDAAEAFANHSKIPKAVFLDEHVADGSPGAWMFAFRGANRTHGAVVGVTASGVLQDTRMVPLERIAEVVNNSGFAAVQGWLVDSDEAVATVRGQFPTFRAYAEDERARLWYLLRATENGTVWEVRMDHGEADPIMTAVLDATTGEMLRLREGG